MSAAHRRQPGRRNRQTAAPAHRLLPAILILVIGGVVAADHLDRQLGRGRREHRLPGRRGRDRDGFGFTAVAPGQARVVQLLGRYTGTVRHTGLRWVNPFTTRTADLHPDPQPPDRGDQGQRRRRQPDRDRGGRRLAGQRHRQGGVRGRRLPRVRRDPGRDRGAAHRQLVPVRRARRRPDVAAGQRRRDHRAAGQRDRRSGRAGRRHDRRGAAVAPGLCAGDRPGDAAPPAGRRASSRRGPRSSTAPSAWSRWPWTG